MFNNYGILPNVFASITKKDTLSILIKEDNMVGIVLASWGLRRWDFPVRGNDLWRTTQCGTRYLKPDEGPEDIHKKMEDAVSTLEDQDQVLFLVDLWGGTPFNQASDLFDQHKDSWAIVSGMNLPMVIEAYASRFSMNTAREIATHIVETAKEGIKTLPEELMPQEEATPQAAAQPAAPQGAIPEGTVIGDGKIRVTLTADDLDLDPGGIWYEVRIVDVEGHPYTALQRRLVVRPTIVEEDD